jgi:hypothetical protein
LDGAEANRSPAAAAAGFIEETLGRATGAALGALPNGELESLLLPNRLLASPPAFVDVTFVGLTAAGFAVTALSKGFAAFDEPNKPLASPPFATVVTFFSTFLGAAAGAALDPKRSAAAEGAAFANGSDISPENLENEGADTNYIVLNGKTMNLTPIPCSTKLQAEPNQSGQFASVIPLMRNSLNETKSTTISNNIEKYAILNLIV